MRTSQSELAEVINKKILENFAEYIKLFTPVQSNFLSDIYKRYKCLDSASIVLFFAKKTHQAILRKKEYDLNYDLSFEKFWYNHNEANIENSTIIEVAKKTNLPKETARRKIKELEDKILELKEVRPYLRGLSVWVGFKQSKIYYVRDARFSGKAKFSTISAGSVNEFINGVTAHSIKPLYIGIVLGFFSIFFPLQYFLVWSTMQTHPMQPMPLSKPTLEKPKVDLHLTKQLLQQPMQLL